MMTGEVRSRTPAGSVYFDTSNPNGDYADDDGQRRPPQPHTSTPPVEFDFQTETFHGNADTPDKYVALCEALGG